MVKIINKIKSKNHNGFTLIELLLYVGIASTLLLVAVLFLATLLEARVKNQTIAEVDQQGLQIMQIISNSVSEATAITSPNTGNNSTSLTLQMNDIAVNPTIFSLNNGVLEISEAGAPVVALSNNRIQISNLVFTNLSRLGTPGIVQIKFTASYVNNSGRNEYNYSRDFQTSISLH